MYYLIHELHCIFTSQEWGFYSVAFGFVLLTEFCADGTEQLFLLVAIAACISLIPLLV